MVVEEIVFSRVDWSPEVGRGLAKACGWAFEHIRHEVREGIAECWKIAGYGLLVTRFEVEPEKTLVCVAGQGKGMLKILEALENIARRNGCKNIRIHSGRVGMARFLKHKEYEVEHGLGETVFYGRI